MGDSGKRIEARRKHLGMTAEDLAKRIGKSRATVYRYESGEIEDIPVTVIKPLAEVLETSGEYLMGWIDDPEWRPEEMKEEQTEKRKAIYDKIDALSDDERFLLEKLIDKLLEPR